MKTSLWDDIVGGKYNLTLFAVLSIFIFHIYYKLDCIKESMSNTEVTPQIKEAVKQQYAADVEAIRNLSDVAIKLQKEGLIIPGNLTVTGTIISKGDITVGEKDKSDGKITLINKQGGSGLYMSSNHDKLGGSIYFYAPENAEGKFEFKNHIHWDSSTLIAKGMVLAWSGDKAPEGWALCDGQNGTPDLRGRFIRMYSETIDDTKWGGYYKPTKLGKHNIHGGWKREDPKSLMLSGLVIGEYGGSDLVQMDPREMPSHSHRLSSGNFDNKADDVTVHHRSFKGEGGGDRVIRRRDNDGSLPLVKVSDAGLNWAHPNNPPFYVLAYIMKL